MRRHISFHCSRWIIMLAVIFGGLQQVRAQKNGESIRVSLNVENQAILSVLESITDQTNILFSYNPDALDENRFVSISVENEELDAVLQNIFPDTNRYERIGYHVILYPPKKRNNRTRKGFNFTNK
ncbi:STN domain-containing protein [Bacteroidales bacterium OttesenSCG-928-A14]|nr:STN domain-containing protein [Bacteroidales bacterium OttesenSCG-928-A14]